MTNAPTEISEDEFDARYALMANHLNPNAGWAYGDCPGCLFETYGQELAFVRQQDPRTVWTLTDGNEPNRLPRQQSPGARGDGHSSPNRHVPALIAPGLTARVPTSPPHIGI
jgi:hypothetical protein